MRHEQVAAHAADGYARVTRKASVLLTHLGPGLTNAATGVANAALDCIPMVVIAGDVPSHYFGKHPHQEVNLHADGAQYEIYRPFVKRAWRVDDPKLFPGDHRQGIPARRERPARSGAGRRSDGRVLRATSTASLFTRLDANTRALRKPSLDLATAREIVTQLARGAARRCCMWAAAWCSPMPARNCARSSITSEFPWRTASWARVRCRTIIPCCSA